MKQSKTIVVMGCEDILNLSLTFLLAEKDCWNVVRIQDQAALERLIQSLDYPQSEIVIIHQGNQNDSDPALLKLFQKHSTIKLITISLENNLVDVYSKQKILTQETSDLIAIIENNRLASPEIGGEGVIQIPKEVRE
jgi:hypothetical protein